MEIKEAEKESLKTTLGENMGRREQTTKEKVTMEMQTSKGDSNCMSPQVYAGVVK